MDDSYQTINHKGEGLYKEKMSKFISFAVPASNPDEAKNIIKDIQNRYHDARHVCWAYAFGPDKEIWQLNDNGEPSGTAGKPILGQIRSLDVTDLVVVVVRYFGGIKLGTPGLTAAYREAARLAIDDGEIVVRRQMRSLSFTFPYLSMNDVMKVAKSADVEIIRQVFDNVCQMELRMPRDLFEEVKGRLNNIDGVSLLTMASNA